MRTAITAIIFVLILVTGPFWFALVLRVLPFASLEFMGAFIVVAVAAFFAWLYWYLSRPKA